MTETSQWTFPPELQPIPDQLAFDLQPALNAVVMLHAEMPEDAFTAQVLGTERVGNGIVIGDDGLILTIGYLITEAESIWITATTAGWSPVIALAYDFATGFGPGAAAWTSGCRTAAARQRPPGVGQR